MNRLHSLKYLLFLSLYFGFVLDTSAQRTRETYTGTIVSFATGASTRSVTRTFTLSLTGRTSDNEVERLIGILQDNGQERLLEVIRDIDLGRFAFTGRTADDVNIVRTRVIDGKERIFAVFARRVELAEVRFGYRSLDYPFSVLELMIDRSTGRGQGTFIGAARIRWRQDRSTREEQIEIEDFGTFPSKVIGVRRLRN